MGWKIPTFGDGIGAVIGVIPRAIKWFKDRGRIHEVDKIDKAVDTNDDAAINAKLRDIEKGIRDRYKTS